MTTFQEKADGPSSLLLKSYIHAYALKDEEQAVKSFRELIFKYPGFIKGYIEYWQYLSICHKSEKIQADRLVERAKQNASGAERIVK